MILLLRVPLMLLRVVFQTAFLALGQVWANKVRSVLTTLGVIIGVASIVAVVASLQGLKTSVLSEFEKFGTKRVFIDGELPPGQRGWRRWREVQLTLDEVDAIIRNCPSLTKISPTYFGGYQIQAGDIVLDSIQVTGIWPSWHDIENRQVIKGRPFSRIDEEERRQVCVINEKAIEELRLDRDPVGDFLLISGRRFLIVGIVETYEAGLFGPGDQSSEILIPFATARVLNPEGWINFAQAELSSPDKVEDARAEIAFVMRQMRQIKPGDPDTFEIQVMQQFIDQFNSLARAVTAGAGGIVGISLLVGGIGIMNIMLVSVSERTREIGLRKAMGARPAVILVQFLVEAIVLCLVGAAVGLALGQGLVLALKQIPDAPLKDAAVPMWAVLLSAGFSAATGVIFGMFPAIKAARLDPIDALRHE